MNWKLFAYILATVKTYHEAHARVSENIWRFCFQIDVQICEAHGYADRRIHGHISTCGLNIKLLNAHCRQAAQMRMQIQMAMASVLVKGRGMVVW